MKRDYLLPLVLVLISGGQSTLGNPLGKQQIHLMSDPTEGPYDGEGDTAPPTMPPTTMMPTMMTVTEAPTYTHTPSTDYYATPAPTGDPTTSMSPTTSPIMDYVPVPVPTMAPVPTTPTPVASLTKAPVVPTAKPITTAVPITLPVPTPFTTAPNSPDNLFDGPRECALNEACVGLADNCCPTIDNVFLCTFVFCFGSGTRLCSF